ncbi:unnamed protein product, partial [marine sediment metagenome]
MGTHLQEADANKLWSLFISDKMNNPQRTTVANDLGLFNLNDASWDYDGTNHWLLYTANEATVNSASVYSNRFFSD